VWQINALGVNSDEAVYAGQAASIANNAQLKEFFPIFRAHPLLFQSVLSVGYHLGGDELFGRLLSAAIGVGTIWLAYKLGHLLYGRTAGILAALFLAVMPYHVVVTRQILLDGPMVFFATLTLYLIARFAVTERPAWLYAAGAAMGLTILAKEPSVVLICAIFLFFALAPSVRVRMKDIALSALVMLLVITPFPLSVIFAGKAETGGQYLAWQLFRRPNHGWSFYPTNVTEAIGPLLIVLALAGLWLLRRHNSWRETLLLSWLVVPAFFFELWPVKGFQYLLPIAPAIAVLAGRTVGLWSPSIRSLSRRVSGAWLRPLAAGAVALTLIVPTWGRIQPGTASSFLAGSGGVPGGREAGQWIAANVPEGAQLLTIGPSMANILQFYGHRKAYGLSVSPNPLHRNPAYEPVKNPDFLIRNNDLQYVVWDTFSASRSKFFSDKLLRYADRYNGRVVHTETMTVSTGDGQKAEQPMIIIYEVRP
jgi:4-amino-4-deoxy-L-arabinose transferase-like glycosyltransferase